MRKLITIILLCTLSVLSACTDGQQIDTQKGDQTPAKLTVASGDMIPVVKGLKQEDVLKIRVISSTGTETLTTSEDISICLVGMQGIRLTQKSDKDVSEWSRSFEFELKDGSIIAIRFGFHQLNFGEDNYYYDESNNPIVHGYVRLTTQGKIYDPAENWVYSQEYEGLFADGMWFGPGAVEWHGDLKIALDGMEPVPYSDDFKIKCVWEYEPDKPHDTSFNVYDSSLNKLSEGLTELEIPDESGIYYVAVFGHWGTDYRYEGCQYIFKIKRD